MKALENTDVYREKGVEGGGGVGTAGSSYLYWIIKLGCGYS